MALKICSEEFFFKFEFATIQENMGGDLIRKEPFDHTTLLNDNLCIPLLQASNWMTYILMLSNWDEEVTLQFLQTLKDGVVEVKGLRVPFSLKIVVEIMELPLEGEEFSDAMDLVIAQA